MFGMHLGRTREKIIAVADIGSGSTAVAVVAVPAKGPVRILAAERRFLPLEERVPEAVVTALGTHLIEAGRAALATHQKNGGLAPESVYAIVRAPWTRSKTVRAQESFPEAVKITDKMIGKLAQQALASDTELDKKNILEATVIRVEVNGYATTQPEGATGHRLSVAALISDCDAKFRASLTNALQQLFGGQKVIIRSGVNSILSALRNKADSPSKNFLVVDMASEGTNFIVMHDGITTDHATVPEGKNAVLKRINGNGMTEETLTLLRLSARGECHDAACEAVNVAMAKAEPELVRVFGEAMAKLVTQQRLPNQLILATHDDLVPWLSSFLSRIDFAQFTATTQPFMVSALKPTDLSHLALPGDGVHADTGVLLAAALVNIEEQRV